MKTPPAIWLLVALLGVTFTLPLHAQLPNAWQITDNSTAGDGALNYTTNLPSDLRATINRSGFSFSATVRVLTNHPGGKTMALGYGLEDSRFLVWLDLDSNGDLIAELDGGLTYTLTTNGTGAAAYHTHEIDYTGSVAAYRVDGYTFTTTWPGSGNTLTAGQIFWGAGSTSGTGAMNMHQLSVDVPGIGVVAQYDAGTDGNPAVAPDPRTQGWANNISPTNAAPVSPDTVAFPATQLVTTLPGTALTPHQARLEGVLNTGGQMAAVWFQWGTDVSYGNTTPQIFLKGDTNDVFMAQNIAGLAAGATYHYRLVVYNFGISLGQDETVMTLPSFVVTSLANSGPGSLRQAIADALAGDSIVFATNGTITLASGQLAISKDLTITGPGPETLAISGNNATRVLSVAAASTATISGLTIRDGRTSHGTAGAPGTPATISIRQTGDGEDGGDGASGGGLHNSGTLTLSNCVIVANRTGNGGSGGSGAGGNVWDSDGGGGGDGGRGGKGGGIYNAGILNLFACTVTNNSTGVGGNGGDGGDAVWLSSGWGSFGGRGGGGGWGGAICNAGALELLACVLDDNACGRGGTGGQAGTEGSFPNAISGGPGAPGDYGIGGGIFNDQAVASIISSTLSGGLAACGGGICNYNQGTLTLFNSTLSGNTANFYSGGGIYNQGTLTIIGATLSGNAATSSNPTVTPYGGGILNDGALFITNTIVSGNTLHDLAGSGSISSVSNLVGGDPMLAPLGSCGGPTPTMRPLSGSPAIDAGQDSVTNLLATDQRGYQRLSGAHADIGAVEAQWAPADNPPVLARPAVSGSGAATLSVTNIPNVDLTVLASTNVALPLMQWLPIGFMSQVVPGEYQFTDARATNYPTRFYRLVSP